MAKKFWEALEQLLLPLTNLNWVQLITSCNFGQWFVTAQGVEGNLCLELWRMDAAFGHLNFVNWRRGYLMKVRLTMIMVRKKRV